MSGLRQGRTWGQAIAALAIFGSLGYYFAPNFIFQSMKHSGTDVALSSQCEFQNGGVDSGAWRTHTGVDGFDKTMCILIAFFTPVLEPTPTPIAKYFYGTHAPLVLIPLIEGKRLGAWFPVKAPMVMWGVYQMFTIGAGSSWYWLGFVLLNGSGRGKTLTKRDAREVLTSFILGSFVPFTAMMTMHSPIATAVWQFFPLLVAVSGLLYSLLAPSREDDRKSGSGIVRQIHAAAFVASAITHWLYVSSLELGNLSWPTPIASSVREGADALLQWDLLFGYGIFLVGTWWFARTAKQLVALVVWSIVGSIIVGPGAALAVTSIWREYDVDAGVKEQ